MSGGMGFVQPKDLPASGLDKKSSAPPSKRRDQVFAGIHERLDNSSLLSSA